MCSWCFFSPLSTTTVGDGVVPRCPTVTAGSKVLSPSSGMGPVVPEVQGLSPSPEMCPEMLAMFPAMFPAMPEANQGLNPSHEIHASLEASPQVSEVPVAMVPMGEQCVTEESSAQSAQGEQPDEEGYYTFTVSAWLYVRMDL